MVSGGKGKRGVKQKVIKREGKRKVKIAIASRSGRKKKKKGGRGKHPLRPISEKKKKKVKKERKKGRGKRLMLPKKKRKKPQSSIARKRGHRQKCGGGREEDYIEGNILLSLTIEKKLGGKARKRGKGKPASFDEKGIGGRRLQLVKELKKTG